MLSALRELVRLDVMLTPGVLAETLAESEVGRLYRVDPALVECGRAGFFRK